MSRLEDSLWLIPWLDVFYVFGLCYSIGFKLTPSSILFFFSAYGYKVKYPLESSICRNSSLVLDPESR